MTVKELIERLRKLPDDLNVIYPGQEGMENVDFLWPDEDKNQVMLQ